METSTMTVKGQILVPAKIRKREGMKKGTIIIFLEKGDDIIIKPLTKDYFERYAGIFNDKGNELDILLEERKKDKGKGK